MSLSSPEYPTVAVGRQDEDMEPTALTVKKTFYLPIYIVTGVFGGIIILAPILIRKGPYKGITTCCIMLSAFCLWIFWVTMYIAQMNPLLGPRLTNTSLAWVGHSWGKDPKELNTELEETD